MKKYIGVVCFCAAMITPIATMAFDNIIIMKGSFRNIYPDAIFKSMNLGHDAEYFTEGVTEYKKIMSNDKDKYKVEDVQAESVRARATKFCQGKSQYAVVDNYDIHVTPISGGSSTAHIFVDYDYNIICFNLPSDQKLQKKK